MEPSVACGLCYGWVVPLVYLWVWWGLWFTFVHSYWVYGVFFWCIATRVLVRVRGLCTGFVCRAGSHHDHRFMLVCGQLHVVSKVPCSGLSARRVVGRLYNASGHCNWWLVVRGHCILDAGFSSVMVCELVASCMNVCIVVFALWLFFLMWFVATRCA